ncbi:uncharacterized protein LOC120327840 [Styela clava]
MNKRFPVVSNFDDFVDNFLSDEESSDFSDSDEIDSDVEFHLYSQLHYAAENEVISDAISLHNEVSVVEISGISADQNENARSQNRIEPINPLDGDRQDETPIVETCFSADQNAFKSFRNQNKTKTINPLGGDRQDETATFSTQDSDTRFGQNFDSSIEISDSPSSKNNLINVTPILNVTEAEETIEPSIPSEYNPVSESKQFSYDSDSLETDLLVERPNVEQAVLDDNSSHSSIDYIIENDFIVTDEVSGDESNSGLDRICSGTATPTLQKIDEKNDDKVFNEEDLSRLREHLDSETSDFVPETWEIVDSVEDGSSDSCDGGIDLHISEKQEEPDMEMGQEPNDAWIPEKGPKSCWKIDIEDTKQFTTNNNNAGRAGRYFVGNSKNSGIRCRNCDEVGHKVKDCTVEKKGPACFMCGNRGHVGRDCPQKEGLRYRGRHMVCNRCSQEGHIQIDCPDLWRQFHITTKPGPIQVPTIPVPLKSDPQCFNCAGIGHFGHECESPRANQFYAMLAPYVQRYDKKAVSTVPQDLRKKLKGKRSSESQGSSHFERSYGGNRGNHGDFSQEKESNNNYARRKERQHIIFDSPERQPSKSRRHGVKVQVRESRQPSTERQRIAHNQLRPADKALRKKSNKRSKTKFEKEIPQETSSSTRKKLDRTFKKQIPQESSSSALNFFDKRVVSYEVSKDDVQFSKNMRSSKRKVSYKESKSQNKHYNPEPNLQNDEFFRSNSKNRKSNNPGHSFERSNNKKRKFIERGKPDRGFRRHFN